MSYEEVYRKTEIVATNVLAVWQKEFDAINDEINAFESQEKERLQNEKEAEKAVEDADRVAEQLERDDLIMNFAYVSKVFGTHNSGQNSKSKLSSESKRSKRFYKKELKELNKPKLLNEPLPEIKLTKEEIEAEKRKAGRLMDHTKWDDLKQADVYGFEYSSHPKHLGAQPIPIASRKRGFGEVDVGEGRSGRAQRMATRKMYDQSTPEDESDVLPAKRQRKIRVLDDAIGELSKTSRKQSRSQTPVRRTFPSGKPIGRPPKISLKAQGYEGISRHLLPAEQEELQQSAESLVNQVAEELPIEPIVKKKHAGGRPRKHPLPAPAPVAVVDIITPAEAATAPSETPAAIVPPIKPRAKVIKPKKQPATSAKSGSRVKKEANSKPSAETEEENAILPTTEHDEDSDSQATGQSRPGSSSSQSTISSYATRNRGAASVEKSGSVQESPKKVVRGKRTEATCKTSNNRKKLKKGDRPHEPVIKKEATPASHPIMSPPSSRTKRKRASEAASEAPAASPTKKARKGRPSKSSSTPADGPPFMSASSPKIKINKKAKGPLARILPPREPSTRARRAPKAIRNADDAGEDEDEDEDELNMPAHRYERYQALADPRSPITLGKRIRKSVIDLRTAMEGGDDEDGDDEFEG
ncbi:hypothetical protein DID88_008905 [Monilinia fructigena]|uniref:Uncharacterized protein n=1 Tax=Monilinia fructigena TaxID=38457 RepID=A0A395JBT7_9HELO|nr:hypothetical protein DID88_008905 [Monilinia fructigena]